MQFQGMNFDDARAFAETWLPAWTGNQPKILASFYSDDAIYSDPGIPNGVSGREGKLARRSILIVAGIHGNETAGLLAVSPILDLLETNRPEHEFWNITIIAPANPVFPPRQVERTFSSGSRN